MTDEKCKIRCPYYVQDGQCDNGDGTIVLGPQFYEDCLLRLESRKVKICPKCKSNLITEEYTDTIYRMITMRCHNCRHEWNERY